MRAMFGKLPDLVDPVYSAQHHKQFVSRVKQGQLKRLSSFLAKAQNDIKVEVVFYIYPQLRFPAFDLQLETVLLLQCQRSLKVFEFPVKSSLTGVFVETLSLADDVPDDVEVYELKDEKISLVDLIEEDLLLNLPMVPVDESSEMGYSNPEKPAETETEEFEAEKPEKPSNPFAALKGLQTKD